LKRENGGRRRMSSTATSARAQAAAAWPSPDVAVVTGLGLVQVPASRRVVTALLFQCLNPTWTCDSGKLTNIHPALLRLRSLSLPAATPPHLTFFPLSISLAAAGLVIAAGSALPEHHNAALNRFPQAKGRRYSRPPRALGCSSDQETDPRHRRRPARHTGHDHSLARHGLRRRLQQLAGERGRLFGRPGQRPWSRGR
jgi:hypothetical protein